MKYSKVTLGKIESMINMLGGEKGMGAFLRGETTVRKSDRIWFECDGIVYLSVVSEGLTGDQWLQYFKEAGHRLTPEAKALLLSEAFVPTTDVVYEVAIVKGFNYTNEQRNLQVIDKAAERCSLSKPNVEIGCLLRKALSDADLKEMNLSDILTMHDANTSSFSNTLQRLLAFSWHEDGDKPIYGAHSIPIGFGWDWSFGFAYIKNEKK